MSRSRRRRGHRPHIHKRTKPGTDPDVLVKDPSANPSSMQLIAYGPHDCAMMEVASVEKIGEYLGRYPVTWLNVNGLADTALIERLGKTFGLHRLALEDIVNTHQRAKVDEYDNGLFIVARMADLELRPVSEQLSMFVGENYVVTFQEEPGDCWLAIRERLRAGIGRIRHQGPDYLAYALLDAAIDAYFPVLERVGERLDTLEDIVVASPTRKTLDDLHAMKSELLMLRRTIWPHREAVSALLRESTPLITDTTRVYLRDCYDHVIQINDLVETYRELSADLRDLYMSSVSNRINETMRVLTIIATIFIPVTFIASVYGMNFEYLPELKWRYGYPLALSLMVSTALGMLYYFWRCGWLSASEDLPTK
ncbi:MAG: Magnesium transport protein CorA [Planctomycetota bacterium]|jgi:magnesium transporter